MKKNNRNTILTVITASLLLLATGCSQSAETVNVAPDITTTDSTTVTTINTEAETPKETTAVTTAQTTAQITTAAATTVITTAHVTEAQSVTAQKEVQEAPVITTTTTTAAPVVTTTTTTTPAPKKEEPEDRSYLNLSPSEVQSILDECANYAKSLGYRILTYEQYSNELEEMYQRAYELQHTEEYDRGELGDVYEIIGWYEWIKSMYITDYGDEEFWSTGWHNIAFAGDYDLVKGGDMDGYWLCKTKQESIDWLLGYLKFYIKLDYDEGRSSGAIATPLKTFDKLAKEGKCIFPYDVVNSYYADYMVYDINTSYAFCVKLN